MVVETFWRDDGTFVCVARGCRLVVDRCAVGCLPMAMRAFLSVELP